MPPGKVYLVGAGIGSRKYLTLRAQEILAQATVVVSDALADRGLQNLTAEGCEWIDAGKRGGGDSVGQGTINQLLIDRCRLGQTVVRLKSGDPWVFGRAFQELTALEAAGCAWEVVPGISSALAGPLLAGIPLTETDRSNCFAVATGHDVETLPWEALGQIPTLVILMGARQLPEICQRLRFHCPPSTPIGVIYAAGSSEQQVTIGTLEAPPTPVYAPAVIVVGQGVTHHTRLSQFPALPLAPKQILVTRSAGQSSSFSDELQALGATTIEMPTLTIAPPTSWEPLDRAIGDIDRYQWLVLTSSNSVDAFFGRLRHCRKDSRALHNLQIAVVGQKTAACLGAFGIMPDLIPPDFIADSLLAVFPNPQNQRILFPRVESGGREVLIAQLESQGAWVDAIPAYESACPDSIPSQALQALQAQSIDVITFASSKTVLHFAQLLDRVTDRHQWQTWITSSKIASIGTQTSHTCRKVLGRVDIEAQEFTLPGLTKAILNYFLQEPL